MKKSVLMFSLLSGTALMLPDLAVASGIFSTHKSTPQPEPAFQFEQPDKAYKTAGSVSSASATATLMSASAKVTIIKSIPKPSVRTKAFPNRTATRYIRLTASVLTMPPTAKAASACLI